MSSNVLLLEKMGWHYNYGNNCDGGKEKAAKKRIKGTKRHTSGRIVRGSLSEWTIFS